MGVKPVKAVFALVCSCLLIFGAMPINSFAAEKDSQNTTEGTYDSKDETVYGTLAANGQTNSMYVVNTFHITKPGQMTDFGSYTNVRNLTNLTDIKMPSDNKVSFEADNSEFYYQGELKKQPLPWDIDITYTLDGKAIEPANLAGKSGQVEIRIETRQNDKVDPVFFNNYLQQISVTMDPAKFNNIHAPKGTKANAGKNQQITFTVLPEKEDVLIISADATEFELDPIELNALPANIAIEDPDFGALTSDMQTLSDAIDELDSGVTELNGGISDLNSGANDLNKGSSDYRSGITTLNQKSGDLIGASEKIQSALNEMKRQMSDNLDTPDLSELQELPKGLKDLADALNESADGLTTLKKKYNKAYEALDEAIQEIPGGEIKEEDLMAIKNSDADQKAIDQLLKTHETAQKIKNMYLGTEKEQGVKEAFAAVPKTLKQVTGGLSKIVESLNTTASEVESGFQQMDQLNKLDQLKEGIASLANEYSGLHSGLVSYTDGVQSLSNQYKELDNGLQSLSNGIGSVNNGASELQQGSHELAEETKDLPGEMEAEIQEKLDEFDYSDFDPVSFTSEKNEKIEVVQFVLKTESIELPEPETPDEQDKQNTQSIWQRFLDLFR